MLCGLVVRHPAGLGAALLTRTLSHDRKLADQYTDFVSPHVNTRADLTMKAAILVPPAFVGDRMRWRRLDEDTARATATRFVRRLTREVYGRHRCSNDRVAAAIWAEYGRHDGRLHLHALLGRPGSWSERDFARAVRRAWKAQPFAHQQMRIEPIRDKARSIAYNSKSDKGYDNLVFVGWSTGPGDASAPEDTKCHKTPHVTA